MICPSIAHSRVSITFLLITLASGCAGTQIVITPKAEVRSTHVRALDGLAFITGTVVDTSGTGLQNVWIGLVDLQSGDTIKTVSSNDKGAFTIERTPPGEYSVHVNYIGYVRARISRMSVKPNSLIDLDICLKPAFVQAMPMRVPGAA